MTVPNSVFQQREGTTKPEGEPRLSHARLAVPEDPTIRPYGCNSPRCTPSYEEYTIAQAKHQKDLEEWKKAQAVLDSDPSTAGQRPPGQHPSLNSIGVSFAASRDLLDHLRNAHEMRQKGEVHISQLIPGQHEYGGAMSRDLDELGEDGKMFRCALIGCQRTWKVSHPRFLSLACAYCRLITECERLTISLLDVCHSGRAQCRHGQPSSHACQKEARAVCCRGKTASASCDTAAAAARLGALLPISRTSKLSEAVQTQRRLVEHTHHSVLRLTQISFRRQAPPRTGT